MLSAKLMAKLTESLAAATTVGGSVEGPKPKYGDDIFPAGATIRSFDEFVGQRQALLQLRASVNSSLARGVRLDHVLLASGNAGVGKSTLARIIAAELGSGIVEITGKLTVDDMRPILLGMRDGDVLFIDEIHTLVAGGKAAAEGWLLSLMADGGLSSKTRGFERMPDITVIGATTDAQNLTDPFLTRFSIQPVLVGYSDTEGTAIAEARARRHGFGTDLLPMPDEKILGIVAAAGHNVPRAMDRPLVALRDSYLASDRVEFDIDLALDWCGLTRDGLDALAVQYLFTLAGAGDSELSLPSLKGRLNESNLERTEQLLQAEGYLQITNRGRKLTPEGVTRAMEVAAEQAVHA